MSALQGKTALITGASRGIGHAIALRFAAEGARVIVVAAHLSQHGKLPGTLEETVAEIEGAGGSAVAIACDLSDPVKRADLIERASQHFGPIDILVNNAAGAVMKLPSKVSREERNWMYELNLNAPIDLSQQVLEGMRQRKQGWILNITSASAKQPAVPYRDSQQAAFVITAYGATKAALDRYTEGLAHEVAADGVFINAMAPTSIVLTSSADYVRNIARKNPDMVEPVEMMAEAALELCRNRHVGKVVLSRDIVHSVGGKVMSLDGKTELGDAFLLLDDTETTA